MGAISRGRGWRTYTYLYVGARRCALASTDRPGGGLIGHWRHDGGSGKRGHVRPLSNGNHPPIHPTHPQSRHSLVSPTATLSVPSPLPPPVLPSIPDRLASSHSSLPRLFPNPLSRACARARVHLHQRGVLLPSPSSLSLRYATTTTPLTLIHAVLNYGMYI